MSEDLYQRALLRLAADATGAGRLAAPDGSAVVDNPLCGDRVTMDVAIADGAIARLGHEVRACVLCQAAASILGAQAEGQRRADIAALRDRVTAMLREDAPPPEGRWRDFEIFLPVRPYRNRHSCVLLPIEALEQALADAA